ncbi:hypothetical protein GGTG_07907 [Gaeumannomyces tritici R3-111a-1]|uniref:Alb1-domain-containing protein n=1 Tax=Gaeumannomyces tritici (strain R3-111a-1) TaxID=644352 RepID=J3P316_GAET3|nr:hypothetical protein GGTG_07907 [Gaeumannomyces tritici R3-111a-1]EJT74058.1 hypothetical protein GGTG_07907 [Gaeumannomyces tritici R3-111a-1]
MAKNAPSKHSRAARRATSPSIDTDKSLKNVKPPAEPANQRPAVLAAQHGAGVGKKGKSGRKAIPSSRARRRHEKGMDRAEAVMDRTLSKIEKSKGQARTVQSRRKAWDDINTSALAAAAADGDDDEAARPKKKKTAKQLQAEAEQALVDKFYNDDGDEDMDGADSDGGETRPAAAPQPGATAARDDDEEIL